MGLLCTMWLTAGNAGAQPAVLSYDQFGRYVERFNANDGEQVVNLIPNAGAWDWLRAEIPLLDCPSTQIEETYYFRWWTFRKHIKQTPAGRVLTEFILPVTHAGPYNTVACAFGHHVAEGRWLRDQGLLDEYTRFWLRSGEDGRPAKHWHQFSSWAAAALYDRHLVRPDATFLENIFEDLVADYRTWEEERGTTDGMFWQHDVKDGMEESISGGRHAKNIRPTINSYMAANARAIARMATLARRPKVASQFDEKFRTLRARLVRGLWDEEAEFYKVRLENGQFSTAREAIGWIPWTFGLALPEHTVAWRQLSDPQGFRGPWGLTTAERRHPEFRTHGVGTCEWDGAAWPFATSQTLGALANVLRGPPQDFVSRRDYFAQLLLYAQAHQQDGMPYIGEYYDEQTGDWLITGPKAQRSRFYNHSTFNDLVITGLAGIVPREDDVLEVDPLLPPNTWDWFCLDGVPYHGYAVTILWDRTGQRYHRGTGLVLLADGEKIAQAPDFKRITVKLPRKE
jgi:hypothetical protein